MSSQTEGLAADDEYGKMYIAEETLRFGLSAPSQTAEIKEKLSIAQADRI